MNLFSGRHKRAKVIYPKWPAFPIAITTALFILIYDEESSYSNLLTSASFYKDWLASSIMALLIIWFIYRATLSLDYHFPWYRNYTKRKNYQLFYGVFIPLILAFISSAIYFISHEVNIFETIWLNSYLRQIIFMLIIFNMLFFYYWHMQWNKRSYRKQFAEASEVPGLLMPIPEIACIFILAKHYYWVGLNGEQGGWHLNIQQTKAHLPAHLFYFINRGYAVNFKAIQEIKIISAKKTIIILTPAVKTTVTTLRSKYKEDSNQEFLKVSNSENTAFKKAYALYLFETKRP